MRTYNVVLERIIIKTMVVSANSREEAGEIALKEADWLYYNAMQQTVLATEDISWDNNGHRKAEDNGNRSIN